MVARLLEKPLIYWAFLAILTLAVRLAHLDILWVEEAYGLAAAQQLHHGLALYRDLWFDKPPLYALFYWPVATLPPVALRVWDSLYVLGCAYATYRLIRDVWQKEREALLGAGLMTFFFCFDTPSAAIALAPDTLMVLPHLLAMRAALLQRGYRAGFWCGIALLVNIKALALGVALLVLAASSRDARRRAFHVLTVCLGGCVPVALAVLTLWMMGAWQPFVDQTLRFGFLYAGDTFLNDPWKDGLSRTLGWLGFHAVLLAGLWKERDGKLWIWLLLNLLPVAAGLRFFPRYYFQPLVPLTVLGARHRFPRILLILLLIPVIRFGPRHVILAWDQWLARPHQWADVALNQDSQIVGHMVRNKAAAGNTILVWGYRPDIIVYSGLKTVGYLDSQPLNGVLADRHLSISTPTVTAGVKERRERLTMPDWVVDGLGPLNPSLKASSFLDLTHYREAGRVKTAVVYQRMQ